MENSRLIVFSDFDGTFTARDVGNRIFTHFSGAANHRLVEDWKKGLITSRECLQSEAEMTRVSPEEFFLFLDSFELASGAEEFYRLTRRQNIPFIILSDGLDLYIEYILKKYNLGKIPFYANRGILRDGGLVIEFPYENDGCPRCGSCKGTRIAEIVGRETDKYEVVFIGDGLSDTCALPRADIIFARGDLLDFCRFNGLTAIEYENFFDILDWLERTGRITGTSQSLKNTGDKL
jgi:2-hydroxy-3-keto-5-methylthiopentenyl-1-phosphate phosphatase